jgi:hypothetical protein
MDASSVCVTMLTDNAETELSHMLRSLLCLGKRTVRCASVRHINSLGLDFFMQPWTMDLALPAARR